MRRGVALAIVLFIHDLLGGARRLWIAATGTRRSGRCRARREFVNLEPGAVDRHPAFAAIEQVAKIRAIRHLGSAIGAKPDQVLWLHRLSLNCLSLIGRVMVNVHRLYAHAPRPRHFRQAHVRAAE